MPITVTISKVGTIPDTECITTIDQLAIKIAGVLGGSIIGDSSSLIISKNEPSASDRDKFWGRINNDDSLDRIYKYWNGLWVAKHQTPASGQERRFWVGTEAELKTYDEGEDEAVSAVSGPFWEIDTDFAAKFPVGPGTFAGGDVVGVGDQGGSDELTISSANMPPHNHILALDGSAGNTIDAEASGYFRVDSGSIGFLAGSSTNGGLTRMAGGGAEDVADPFTNLPPYRGAYVIKRTARTHYVAP